MAEPSQTRVAVTVDLEEYFQVEVMSQAVSRGEWERMPARVEANTERLLEIFDDAGARGTFFVVGWVAERYSRLIEKVASAGHELGCHSYWHRPVLRLGAEEFREDTRRAKAAVEDAAGVEVAGYRAPNFSLRLETPWHWEVLAEAGFGYDSSVHPIRHPLYGAATAPRQPFRTGAGLWEIPVATASLWGARLPVGGGAYWRLAPLAYTRWGLRREIRRGLRAVCYLHPWEIDPEQPRVALPAGRRLRHYTGLGGLERKLRALLREFGSRPVRELYATELSAALAGAPA
jgi:polysaccharide deacetylase family protein (PEP-CTERM system associated)